MVCRRDLFRTERPLASWKQEWDRDPKTKIGSWPFYPFAINEAAGAILEARGRRVVDHEADRLLGTRPAPSWGEMRSPTTRMDPTPGPPIREP